MNKRFVGLLLFFNILIVIFTGIILFIMPHGRIAYWIDWKFLGLDKDQWSNIHIISAILFIITMIFHIQVNWKLFLSYFFNKKQIELLKSPLLLSMIITGMTLVLTIYNLPPIKQIITIEKIIKKNWETKYNQPPIPHAERLSLADLCKFAHINPENSITKLRKKGWKINSIKEQVKKISKINHHSPMELWLIIINTEPKRSECRS